MTHYVTTIFIQASSFKRVDREPYIGPVIKIDQQTNDKTPENPIIPNNPQNDSEFKTRGPTRGGSRNMQDSSFNLQGRHIYLSVSDYYDLKNNYIQ